jgi:hypothetical protein
VARELLANDGFVIDHEQPKNYAGLNFTSVCCGVTSSK